MSNNQHIFIREERSRGNSPVKAFSCDTCIALSATVATHEGDTPPGSSILSVFTISVSLSVASALLLHSFSEFFRPRLGVSVNPRHRCVYLREEQQGSIMRDHSLTSGVQAFLKKEPRKGPYTDKERK